MANNKQTNNMTPIDVGCGRLIPYGNLDKNVPGSFGYMYNELQNTYKNSNVFKASTSYGFTPGMTILGKNMDWGSATFHK